MRVIFLTTNLDPFAGWGRYSREIVSRLPALGITPVVLVERSAGPSSQVEGVEVHPVLRPYQHKLRNPALCAVDAAQAFPLTADVDVVHCLAEPHLFTAFALAQSRRRPLMTTAVGTYAVSIVDARLGARFRLAYRQAKVIPSISNYTARRLTSRLPGLTGRITTIPLGVTTPSAERTTPTAAERDKAFLAVGAVKRRKGTHLLISALAGVHKTHDAHLHLVGDDRDTKYVAEVKQLADSLGVAHRVHWHGQLAESDLLALYDQVRGLVMPSLNDGKNFEGFGLVHLEANALGVPTIGARDSGNEDAIEHGRSGYLVRQNDIDDLVSAMRALLGPDEEWDQLSASALAHARTMSWQRTANAYADLYA